MKIKCSQLLMGRKENENLVNNSWMGRWRDWDSFPSSQDTQMKEFGENMSNSGRGTLVNTKLNQHFVIRDYLPLNIDNPRPKYTYSSRNELSTGAQSQNQRMEPNCKISEVATTDMVGQSCIHAGYERRKGSLAIFWWSNEDPIES